MCPNAGHGRCSSSSTRPQAARRPSGLALLAAELAALVFRDNVARLASAFDASDARATEILLDAALHFIPEPRTNNALVVFRNRR